MKKFKRQRRYEYRSLRNGKQSTYSPTFETLEEAEEWYATHGVHAVETLGRNLVFHSTNNYLVDQKTRDKKRLDDQIYTQTALNLFEKYRD